MPRKYHRPPSVRRRKKKAAPSPHILEQEPYAAGSRTDQAAEIELPGQEERPAVAQPSSRGQTAKHVMKDFSHVRSEIVRIVVISGFLLIAIIIASILR